MSAIRPHRFPQPFTAVSPFAALPSEDAAHRRACGTDHAPTRAFFPAREESPLPRSRVSPFPHSPCFLYSLFPHIPRRPAFPVALRFSFPHVPRLPAFLVSSRSPVSTHSPSPCAPRLPAFLVSSCSPFPYVPCFPVFLVSTHPPSPCVSRFFACSPLPYFTFFLVFLVAAQLPFPHVPRRPAFLVSSRSPIFGTLGAFTPRGGSSFSRWMPNFRERRPLPYGEVRAFASVL